MSLKDKAKNKAKRKMKKIAFKVLKPFLPFIIIIVGLFFAICTVIDTVFVTEADMELVSKAESGELSNEEYTEWLQEKSSSSTIITNGTGLVPTRNVYMAYTGIYNNNFTFWNEDTSSHSEHTNCIAVLMYGAPVRCKFCSHGRWYYYKSNL